METTIFEQDIYIYTHIYLVKVLALQEDLQFLVFVGPFLVRQLEGV